jgi:hypothetical protein
MITIRPVSRYTFLLWNVGMTEAEQTSAAILTSAEPEAIVEGKVTTKEVRHPSDAMIHELSAHPAWCADIPYSDASALFSLQQGEKGKHGVMIIPLNQP